MAVLQFDLFTRFFGSMKAVFDMRKHLCWYARGLPGAAALRSLVNQVQSEAELRRAMTDFFASARALENTT
jgi:tRNA-dihydrouridine synthase